MTVEENRWLGVEGEKGRARLAEKMVALMVEETGYGDKNEQLGWKYGGYERSKRNWTGRKQGKDTYFPS